MHRPLTIEGLFPAGRLRRLGGHVDHYPQIDSTNTRLLAQADVLPDGAVAVAELQTAGRGRLGRRWHAPRGAAVMLSVLLKTTAGSSLLEHAAMLGAVAAAEAIETATGLMPRVRWPNDVMLSGRKVAGVLAESRTAAGEVALVLGIGINCLQQRGHFPPELQNSATSLEIESPRAIDRLAVARMLLERIDAWTVDEVDWPRLRESWRTRCDDFGVFARLLHNGDEYVGVIVDVLENGDLTVQIEHGGRRQFAAATTTRIWNT